MNIPVFFILAIVWLLVGLASKKNSNARKQSPAAGKNGAAKSAANNPQAEQPRPQAPAQPAVAPAQPTVLQPSISVTEHDDSVYQGSMYAETGEGYDPCHDEQLSSLNTAEAAVLAPETTEPGLQLGWSGNEVVRGLIMSEILKKRA